MTQAIASAHVHDLIGIGFGPSNLALAIALQERGQEQGPLDALFLDKQADYRWHGNTLVTQSELQISFLKDLVTLRNPTSPYSFVNYLKHHGRLVDFINLGTFYPCRMEFNDYLRWVAGHFQEHSRYGEEVLGIEPVLHSQQVEALRVISRDAQGVEQVRTARSVVVSTGGTPRVPEIFKGLKGDARVFHHSQYLERMAQQPCVNGKPMNRPEVASFHASAAYAGLASMRRAGILNPFDAPVVALITYRVALSRRRDSDASTKDVLDGLQRVVWVNDRLVVRHCPRVLPAEVYGTGSAIECTIVHVTAAGEDPDAAMAGLLIGGLT